MPANDSFRLTSGSLEIVLLHITIFPIPMNGKWTQSLLRLWEIRAKTEIFFEDEGQGRLSLTGRLLSEEKPH